MSAERGCAMPKMTNAQLQARLEAVEAALAEAGARADAAEAGQAEAEAGRANAEALAEARRAEAEQAEEARAAADAERAEALARVEAATNASGAGDPPGTGPDANALVPLAEGEASASGRPRRRGAGRAILSAVCIVLAALLSPVALAASWAGGVLTDTDRFVATYAPLIDDPAVQDFVATETTAAIAREVDIEGLVAAAFDGVTSTIGLPGPATRALGMLQGAAVEAIESLIDQTVRTVVASDAFSAVWEQTLRTSHAQLVATLQGDPAALVRLGDDGVVALQLGPIVSEVRERLVANGVGLASLIPDIDASVELVRSDALPAVRIAYGVAIAASIALPIVCLVLFAVGVLVARRRSTALFGSGIGLAIAMGAVAAAIGVTGGAIGLIVPVSIVPEAVSSLLFWTVAGDLRDVAVTILVLAIAVAVIAWYAGSTRAATRLRGAVDGALGAVRDFGSAHGLTMGRFGAVLHEQRWLVRVAIILVAGVVILFVRPLTVGLVLGTVAVALLVLLVAELLRRPAAATSASGAPPTSAAHVELSGAQTRHAVPEGTTTGASADVT